MQNYFPTVNKPDNIFTVSLNNQLKELPDAAELNAKCPEATISEPLPSEITMNQCNLSAAQIISKLEAKLKDEVEAKHLIMENYKNLYQKYIKTLISLARMSKLLYAKKNVSAINNDDNQITDIPEDQQNETMSNISSVLILSENIDPHEFLSEENLVEILSISKAKQFDSKFVRAILQRLYKIDVLKTKSKRKMTPSKLNVIYHLFKKRIDQSDVKIEEKAERLSQPYINKLINWGKHNLLRQDKLNQ